MADKRTLAANVAIDNVWYGPAWGNADNVPAEAAAQIGDHAWAGHVATVDLADLKVDELIALAGDRGVDLGDATRKAEILNALRSAGVTTVEG